MNWKFGEKWWQIDVTAYVIRLLGFKGTASLKTVPVSDPGKVSGDI
jgi:fatty-acid desaturase